MAGEVPGTPSVKGVEPRVKPKPGVAGSPPPSPPATTGESAPAPTLSTDQSTATRVVPEAIPSKRGSVKAYRAASGEEAQLAELERQAVERAKTIEQAVAKSESGGFFARKFNSLLDVANGRRSDMRAAAQNAVSLFRSELPADLARYRAMADAAGDDPAKFTEAREFLKGALAKAQLAAKEFDAKSKALSESDKYWSGLTADVGSGLLTLGGVAASMTMFGAPLGAGMIAAGAGLGAATSVAAHATLDNQYDFENEWKLNAFSGALGAGVTIATAGLGAGAVQTVGRVAVQQGAIGAGTSMANATAQEAAGGWQDGAAGRILTAGAIGGTTGAVLGAASSKLLTPTSGLVRRFAVNTGTGAAGSGGGALIQEIMNGLPAGWQARVERQALGGAISGAANMLQPDLHARNEAVKLNNLREESAKLLPSRETRERLQQAADDEISRDFRDPERLAGVQKNAKAYFEELERDQIPFTPDPTQERTDLTPTQKATLGEERKQYKAARTMDQHLEDVTKLVSVGDGPLLAPGVKGASEKTRYAIKQLLRSATGSRDGTGAGNADHLATVLGGVLEQAAARKGAPLSQREVDLLSLQTVLTDAKGKGVGAELQKQLKLAPNNLGLEEGNALLKEAQRQVIDESGVPAGSPIEKLMREAADKDGLYTLMANPGDEKVNQAMRDSGMTDDQIKLARARIKDRENVIKPFMLGTWTHGVPHFDEIASTVRAAGFDHATAQEVYEGVLAHHFSAYPTNGLAQLGFRLDTDAMVAAGHLTPTQAKRLQRFSDTALDAYGPYKSQIPGMLREAGGEDGLPDDFRAAYKRELEKHNEATRELPEHAQSQLHNDDSGQFKPLGLKKWLEIAQLDMGPAGKTATNGQLLEALYRNQVQGYIEDNLARGTHEPLIAGAKPAAERLGFQFDESRTVFRPKFKQIADHPELAFDLAARLAADPQIGPKLRQALPGFDPMSPQMNVDAVNWFMSQPADKGALFRLAGGA